MSSGDRRSKTDVEQEQLRRRARHSESTEKRGGPTMGEVGILFNNTPALLGSRTRAAKRLQRTAGNDAVQRLVAASTEREFEPKANLFDRIEAARTGGHPLEEPTRMEMETSFGEDFGGVRLHTDATADQLSRRLDARAFTAGHDIFFRAGAYSPSSPRGRETLTHELTHVIQLEPKSTPPPDALSQPSDRAEREAGQITTLIAGSFTRIPAVSAAPTAAIQREDDGGAALATAPPTEIEAPPSGGEIEAAGAVVSPEVASQLIYAQTILHRLEPLPPDQQARLQRTIAGAPVYAWIQEREAKRTQIDQLQQSLGELQVRAGQHVQARMHGWEIPGGAPPSEEELDDISAQIIALSAGVERLDSLIQPALASLGIGSPADLLRLVEQFPIMWVNRGKQIAYAMLNENAQVVRNELNRYVSSICPIDAQGRADVAGLQAADRDLAEIAEHINSLSISINTAIQFSPPGGTDLQLPPEAESAAYDIAHLEENRRERDYLRGDFESYRRYYGRQYPVLLAQEYGLDNATYPPGSFAQASPAQLEELTRQMGGGILENIEATRENIADETIKVWHLRDVPALTYQSLGVAEDSAFGQAVRNFIEGKESEEEALNLALSALAVAAGVVAAIATAGGAGLLALGAASVSAGIGIYQFGEDWERLQAEYTAENVALDAYIADISANEPNLLPVIMDAVGLVMDFGDMAWAIRALRDLRRPARLLVAGEVARFVDDATAVIGRDAAQTLAARASQRLGVAAAIDTTLSAVRAGARNATEMGQVAVHLRSVMPGKLSEFAQRLLSEGRAHIMDEETLIRILGHDVAEDLITRQAILTKNGFYDSITRNLFVRGGRTVEAISATVIHEVTHALQHLHGRELLDFVAEFQAFKMQQHYLVSLELSAGRQAVPREYHWLLDAGDDLVEQHIRRSYGYAPPAAFDDMEALEDIVQMLRTFSSGAAGRTGVRATEQALATEAPLGGTVETHLLSPEQYLRALRQVFPGRFLDPISRTVDSIGETAAASIAVDPAFVRACSDGNWTLAGTLFHSAAAREGRRLVTSGAVPSTFRFEVVVHPGAGGSRLDVLVQGPTTELVEFDWKTTGRSALRRGSRREMERHRQQAQAVLGGTIQVQQSISWVELVRPHLRHKNIRWP